MSDSDVEIGEGETGVVEKLPGLQGKAAFQAMLSWSWSVWPRAASSLGLVSLDDKLPISDTMR